MDQFGGRLIALWCSRQLALLDVVGTVRAVGVRGVWMVHGFGAVAVG
jgi:hypothetical protein